MALVYADFDDPTVSLCSLRTGAYRPGCGTFVRLDTGVGQDDLGSRVAGCHLLNEASCVSPYQFPSSRRLASQWTSVSYARESASGTGTFLFSSGGGGGGGRDPPLFPSSRGFPAPPGPGPA